VNLQSVAKNCKISAKNKHNHVMHHFQQLLSHKDSEFQKQKKSKKIKKNQKKTNSKKCWWFFFENDGDLHIFQ
jgi:hypothetical protein